MKQKTVHYIYVFFILFSFKGIIAQDLTLKLFANDNTKTTVLKKIKYLKTHKDTISLNLEIDKVSDYLKNIGYFMNTLHKIEKKNNEYVAFFSLNSKIDNAIIKINATSEIYFEKTALKNGIISIPIKKLEIMLSNISKKLDKEGKSFSKVQLKNISLKDKTIFADLEIEPSKKRIINRIIIKGYENFPTSYLKNHYNIKPTTIFNKQKIKEISKISKNLQIITEIKPPEVLFTKDSTLLYMYLRKNQHNNFDGIVSFASKENGDVLFNGTIDIRLNNILDTGEKFQLFWNSIGEEKQEIKLATEIPYIFNSKFSPNISFSIYKQDSTFLNTKFDSKLFYNFNSKIKFAATYNSESSENLQENLTNNIEAYSNYFLGILFQYNIPKNDFFFNDLFHLKINPAIGKRKTDENSINQFKIEASASYIWDLNLRSSIFIKNKTGYLNSDSFIYNELFRIGGANSIRGFNEQSIYTNNYTYINIEYRYLTSEKSYLYTITDLGRVKVNSKNNNLLGIGLGYLFNTRNSQVNIGIVAGKDNDKVSTRNTQLLINWVNYF